MFASVVWTNIYFPHDMVGGELVQVFGQGIEDVELEGSATLSDFLWQYPHSSYWGRPSIQRGAQASLERLRALILDPVPVALIFGTDIDQLKQIREELFRLERSSSAPVRPYLDNDIFEIRLLVQRKCSDGNCRNAVPVGWLWPGGRSWRRGGDLPLVAEVVAKFSTLSIVISTAPPE
jgi:hypothetical protein